MPDVIKFGRVRCSVLAPLPEILLYAMTLFQPELPPTTFDSADNASTAAQKNFIRFQRLLALEFTHHHHVKHYAEKLGMSEANLRLTCALVAGMSPRDCISQRLVTESANLLVTTRLTVQSISAQLGFDEPANFAKFFRREQGCSPSGFREQHSGSADLTFARRTVLVDSSTAP